MNKYPYVVVLLSPFERFSAKDEILKYMDYLNPNVNFNVGFYQPLQRVFGKVVLYDYLKRMTEIGVKGINQEIIDLVKREHPKYVLWVALGNYYEVKESTFDAIRKNGVKIVGWFFDDDTRFDAYSKWLISHIDYFVTNDFEAVMKYRELGAWATRAICTGFPVARDWTNIKERYEVSFVGTKFADREQYIGALNRNGIRVELFGIGFSKFVSYDEMINIFVSSKINLNFAKSDEHGIMKPTIKARIFEVCLSGGFLLTEYFPSIEDYFKIDKEVVCFRNSEEMVDRVAYYLDHDNERWAIAKAGWERATSEYTSSQIMSKVFREIEENSKDQRSKPKQLRMPVAMCHKVSDFYCDWGITFSMINKSRLSRDSLISAISYNVLNMRAWYHYVISFSPHSLKVRIIRYYRMAYNKVCLGRDL